MIGDIESVIHSLIKMPIGRTPYCYHLINNISVVLVSPGEYKVNFAHQEKYNISKIFI
jgi:hypothetical protein